MTAYQSGPPVRARRLPPVTGTATGLLRNSPHPGETVAEYQARMTTQPAPRYRRQRWNTFLTQTTNKGTTA